MSAPASHVDVASRWGLLPFALVVGALAAIRVGALAMPREPPRARALFAMTGGIAAIVVVVRIFGALGVLTQDVLFVTLCAVAVLLLAVRRERTLGITASSLFSRETHPVTAVAVVALLLTASAAYLLPVWQWDALGYHLPYVNFALQRGALADVPPDMPYVSTYPHVTELFFIGWRAMLPDDRLVDAAQIPLGLLGAGAVACIAIELGARRDHAVASGLLWLTLPAVFLQLPTNYVDVASASFLLAAIAFLLARTTVASTLACGVALGLFLGTKPNAPIGTAIVLGVLLVRGWRGGLRGSLAAATAVVVLLGSESYVVNFVEHHNPVWPVSVAFGPIQLPGRSPMQELLDSGPAAPRLHGPIWTRLFSSWLALDAPPAFDMRYGGLGPVFVVALPLAVVTAYRRRSLTLALLAVVTLASPDPAVPRYILAFPGLVLAVATVSVSRLSERGRRWTFGLTGVATAIMLLRATSGLTGEGPSLVAYAHMTESERLRAVGADGSPRPFYDALERLGPHEATAFDASMDLPYLAWPPDLSHAAIRLPDRIGREEQDRILGDRSIRLLIVDGHSPLGITAAKRKDTFTPLFHCKSTSCIGFFRN